LRVNPTDEDLSKAIVELFHEDQPGMSDSDYSEHPSAWLTYGHENGDKWTIYTMDIYRSGYVLFSKHEDQDDDDPAFEKKMEKVSEKTAIGLFNLLKNKKIEEIVELEWSR